ncbi:MAG: hypothetical protein HYR58_01650 [Acidobacteria bacterium]|nr:hypothetical protein [Acidobacteriota bacterium]
MGGDMRRLALTVLICLVAGLPLSAQNRPLRTVDAETVPAGTVRVQVGFDFLQDVDFPLSGLSGDMTSVGVVQIRMGVGKIAEVQLEGAVHHFLDVKKQVGAFVTPVLTGPNSTHDVGDFSIATKIRLLSETKKRPALGFRFGYQMPNSNQSRGIGSNTSNVFAEFILQKHFRKLNLMGNAGVAILQAPAANFTQNDVLTFGAGFSYAAHRRINVVGEVAGFHSTRKMSPSLVGTESRSQGRFGLQILAGGFQWDVAGLAGITKSSPRSGFTFGISRDFRLFDYGTIK